MIEINSKNHCSKIHDNIASITNVHFNSNYTHAYTYLWNCSNSTNYVQTLHEPPILRPCFSSCSTVGHPRVGTKLHPGQGNPRIGWGYRKLHSVTGRILSRILLTPSTHGISFPTCLFHPRVYTFIVTQSIDCFTSLSGSRQHARSGILRAL